ncbi:MAG: cytochrome P450 [Proteobacteria bacterium]|nr:cytochrome P450 [Pseudomonadota bacterium]
MPILPQFMTASSREFKRPPGPTGAVALGIDPETLATLRKLRDEYGDIVSLQRPNGRLAYFINDAAEVRRILVKRHTNYDKGPGFERVKMLLGNGLIVSDGDIWRRSRTMIQPAFSRQKVHDLVDVMVACATTLDKRWSAVVEQGGVINITEETSRFALDLILISTFGKDSIPWLESEGNNPFAFLSRDSTRDLTVVMKVREVRQILLQLIADRRATDTERHFDFMSMYLAALDKNGQAFSDAELLDELITLVVAGFETSANTLNWAWYLLASHPQVEARLTDEARTQFPDTTAVSDERAAAMLYTQQVLEETLRLYPPVWLFTRRARKDDQLADFDVPPGTDIYLSPYLLHRTGHYWPQPDRFDPDRFAISDKPKKEQPFFPFSLGPRRCLGEYFSFLEMKIHLGLLCPRFRMTLVDAGDPGLELGINLRSARDIMLRPSYRD